MLLREVSEALISESDVLWSKIGSQFIPQVIISYPVDSTVEKFYEKYIKFC